MDEAGARLVACLPRLRRYARALTGNRAAADDLVQDTMERGWRKLASWRRGDDMRAWLFSIMHNLYIDQLRHAGIPAAPLESEEEILAPATASLLEIHDLDTALAQLPEQQRQVLLLVALEEMSYAEVADILQVPLGTVMSRLARGRERLRLLLEDRPPAAPLKIVK